MGSRTGISWACATVNTIIGCEKVSEACTNCYAERDFDRRKHFAKWGGEAAGGTRVMTSNSTWAHFARWQRVAAAGKCISCDQYPAIDCATCGGSGVVDRIQTVFVNSLSDTFERWSGPILNNKLTMDREPLFFEGIEDGGAADWARIMTASQLGRMVGRPVTMDDVRARLFDAIDSAPDLMFLLLTKRPENVDQMLGGRSFKNAMLGTTAETQWYADERLPSVYKARHQFAGTFVSVEPMLGPIDLRAAEYPCDHCLDKPVDRDTGMLECMHCDDSGYSGVAFVDWVIVGGETSAGGKDSRPMRPRWAIDIRDWCAERDVRFHFKQFGDWGEANTKYSGELALVRDWGGAHMAGDYSLLASDSHPAINEASETVMQRVGVRNSGRELDGEVHDALPKQLQKC